MSKTKADLYKMDRKVDQTPTTFTLLEDPASKDIIAFKQFDSFQRFLAHRVAKFHDLQSKSKLRKKPEGHDFFISLLEQVAKLRGNLDLRTSK